MKDRRLCPWCDGTLKGITPPLDDPTWWVCGECQERWAKASRECELGHGYSAREVLAALRGEREPVTLAELEAGRHI